MRRIARRKWSTDEPPRSTKWRDLLAKVRPFVGLGDRMSGFELAVSAEMVFADLPFIERVRRIHDLGFAVEIWSWEDKDLAALAATGATFTSMTGYLHGDLIDPETAEELVATAELSIKAAETLGATRLNLHTAELVDGLPARPRLRATGAMWTTALRTLTRLGELGASAGVTFCVENLNTTVDHPGVPLARAKDTLALIEGVGHPNVKMNLDLYHAQIGEGNLIDLVRRCGSAIGEIQVADVPGRCQPGTGEIYYPAVAKALYDMGYRGTVALEGYASGDDVDALSAFRAAFTV
jgi:hydroxypyruvate isomerase